MLLKAIEQIARDNHIRAIALEAQSTNVLAIDFYRKMDMNLTVLPCHSTQILIP